MEPVVEQMTLPAVYGTPKQTLTWADVRRRIEQAERYWLATTRPGGGPHAVPVDGLWLDDTWFFGGSPETVHMRNLQSDQRVVMHLDDTRSAVIAEGTAELIVPSAELADRLVDASEAKYGYSPGRAAYAGGVWTLQPRRVLAWNDLPRDATRFRFEADQVSPD
jgi:pyridoxamine 5'-phosphate oxidase-like protein